MSTDAVIRLFRRKYYFFVPFPRGGSSSVTLLRAGAVAGPDLRKALEHCLDTLRLLRSDIVFLAGVVCQIIELRFRSVSELGMRIFVHNGKMTRLDQLPIAIDEREHAGILYQFAAPLWRLAEQGWKNVHAVRSGVIRQRLPA